MIGYLSGVVLVHRDRELILDVNGVGYLISLHPRLDEEIPPVGGEVSLFIHTLVKEDALDLYGFQTMDERDLFITLLRTSGIGPRLGQALLSSFTLLDLKLIVETGDVRAMTRVPGIGPKTAERLILELRTPLARMTGSAPAARGMVSAAPRGGTPAGDAYEALVALGYKRGEVDQVLSGMRKDGFDGDASVLIREALRRMAR